MDTLSQLKRYTTVVADTGDFERMRQFQPQGRFNKAPTVI